jgi:hypothetical protein
LNAVVGSFGWPFTGRRLTSWLIGSGLIIFLPITIVLVLGYAVEAVRASEMAPLQGPPSWRSLGRILRYGAWLTIALILLSAPFVLIWILLAGSLGNPALWRSSGGLLEVESLVTAGLIVALPWGIVLLVLMPHATDRFAVTQRPRDLFDFASSVRSVRREFAAWNLTVAAIVTAWAIGVACVALCCVGLAPGVFYAILVSAHATAALHPEGAHPSAG